MDIGAFDSRTKWLVDDLIAEFEHSQSATLENMRRMVSALPADSGRWIGEMEEIAKKHSAKPTSQVTSMMALRGCLNCYQKRHMRSKPERRWIALAVLKPASQHMRRH